MPVDDQRRIRSQLYEPVTLATFGERCSRDRPHRQHRQRPGHRTRGRGLATAAAEDRGMTMPDAQGTSAAGGGRRAFLFKLVANPLTSILLVSPLHPIARRSLVGIRYAERRSGAPSLYGRRLRHSRQRRTGDGEATRDEDLAAQPPVKGQQDLVAAGAKSWLDNPCRYSSGNTSVTLGDLRPTAANHRGGPGPLTGGLTGALVVDPRRRDVDGARGREHLPRRRGPVADHQPPPHLIDLVGVRVDIRGDLRLQRRRQHPVGYHHARSHRAPSQPTCRRLNPAPPW